MLWCKAARFLDFIAQKGIGVQTLDRGSGIIISDTYDLGRNYTREENGIPADSLSWIVVPNQSYSKCLIDHSGIDEIKANFNIRVKEIDAEHTLLNVNLVNIQAYHISSCNPPGRYEVPAASTGILEKELITTISKM